MKTSRFYTALQATLLSLFISTSLAQTPAGSTASAVVATVALGPIQTLSCYSGPGPLIKNNTQVFQTSGACQPVCGNLGHPVMAITGGSTCFCGDELPPLDLQVDIGKCNTPCQGFGDQMCGGIGYWQVYLSGLGGDVQSAPNSTTSTSQSSTASGSASHVPATVVVTASATAKPSDESSSGPNKVGIAVGVVVGVVAIAALAGALVFFMKQKRRREIEEEHKAQAAINSFIGSRNSDQKSDSRLDPSVASSYRRESIGSIADERDFSRRILQVRNKQLLLSFGRTNSMQVRNPDRGSVNSLA